MPNCPITNTKTLKKVKYLNQHEGNETNLFNLNFEKEKTPTHQLVG